MDKDIKNHNELGLFKYNRTVVSEYTKINDEVFYAKGPIIKIDSSGLDMITRAAFASPRKRARICGHRDAADSVHEMLIALAAGIYIRPHKHIGKSESFHLIKGSLKVVIFKEDGGIEEVIGLREHTTGGSFYYRLNQGYFHTVLLVTDVVIFHETTNGPFDPNAVVCAPWAPAETDSDGLKRYLVSLQQAIKIEASET